MMMRRRIRHLCIITHRLADVDAYCSAYALSSLFKKYARDITVVFPAGLNAIASKVMQHLSLDVNAVIIDEGKDDDNYSDRKGSNSCDGISSNKDGNNNNGDNSRDVATVVNMLEHYDKDDLILIVDTNNPVMLAGVSEGVAKSKARKIVIDHHPIAGDASVLGIDEMRVDVDASSTCEMVYRLFKELRKRLSKEVAMALLLGVLTDTQNLAIAKCSTVPMLADMCRFASLEECRSILAVERDYSERVARLKAAQRCRLYRVKIGNSADANSSNQSIIIIAVSKVGSHHASAAKALVDLGADLSIVVSSEGSIAKASLRSTQSFYARTRLHLGTDILARISSAGGGHSTAASIALEMDEDGLIRSILQVIKERLGRLDALC
ncbi:manganese-dependent inorganic pyrophosphatase [archaeon HR04]|nr:manganese-dependent inorganic pyrophosphatase [archaeon HR04]